MVARKPQVNPGVGGTGRQPLNMKIVPVDCTGAMLLLLSLFGVKRLACVVCPSLVNVVCSCCFLVPCCSLKISVFKVRKLTLREPGQRLSSQVSSPRAIAMHTSCPNTQRAHPKEGTQPCTTPVPSDVTFGQIAMKPSRRRVPKVDAHNLPKYHVPCGCVHA